MGVRGAADSSSSSTSRSSSSSGSAVCDCCKPSMKRERSSKKALSRFSWRFRASLIFLSEASFRPVTSACTLGTSGRAILNSGGQGSVRRPLDVPADANSKRLDFWRATLRGAVPWPLHAALGYVCRALPCVEIFKPLNRAIQPLRSGLAGRLSEQRCPTRRGSENAKGVSGELAPVVVPGSDLRRSEAGTPSRAKASLRYCLSSSVGVNISQLLSVRQSLSAARHLNQIVVRLLPRRRCRAFGRDAGSRLSSCPCREGRRISKRLSRGRRKISSWY
jgi:hypothetical protein